MKSLFSSKEKANVSYPSPPTLEEMIEDIENSQNFEPLIQLADIIDKRGRSASIGTNASETLSCTPSSPIETTKDKEAGKFSFRRGSEKFGSYLQVPFISPLKKQPNEGDKGADGDQGAEESPQAFYQKVKEFKDKSQEAKEIVTQTEPKLQNLASAIQEFNHDRVVDELGSDDSESNIR